VNIKIAGKWMSIPLKMVSIGIDPYPYVVMLAECPFLFVGLRDSVASVHPIAVDGDSVSVTASEWH
jgi:hypothetical protein